MKEQMHILMIEDNPADARLIDLYLKEAYSNGYVLMTAHKLSAGLDAVLKTSFDVILLDLSLPDSNGLDTFVDVHEQITATPIIVLTGLDDEGVGRSAMKLGAQDFLIKGKIKSKDLSRSIDYSIERYGLHKQLSEYSAKLESQAKNLISEKKKLSEAQKLAHVGSWEIEGVNMTWSEEMHRILGLQELCTAPTFEMFLRFIHPEDRNRFKETIEGALEKRKAIDLHHRIIRQDKLIRILHTKAEFIENEESRFFCFNGTSQDVTERMREEHMEKLVLAATQSYNSVVIRDRKGRIEWVNEGFTKLSGFAIEDVKNSQGEKLKNESEKDIHIQNEYHKRVVRRKMPVTYESKNFTSQGILFWTITTLTPILDENGEVKKIICIDSDITVRKRMEEELMLANKTSEEALMKGEIALFELRTAKKQLEESLKIKEMFLANMSHEIRTPMNAIVGFTDLIAKAELSPELRKYIHAIKISGENLLVIINDILDFSKIQNGKISFEDIGFKLPLLLNNLLELMLPKATQKGVSLFVSIAENVPGNLLGDPIRLRQILLNLLGNAVKFTSEGGIYMDVGLLDQSPESVLLKFSVRDTGIGIPENKLTTIFDGFTQAESDTTRKYGGTGLGLSIAKQLIELQKGIISVESTVGKGTTFSFELRFQLCQDSRKPTGKAVERNEPLPEISRNLNILLVEDNQLNQVLAAKVLTDWNFKVEIAENGVVALEMIRKTDFDLVLMDIQLPVMDGYETTRHIRTTMPLLKSNVPVIAMTAHAMAGEAEKCLEAGMNDYISKPFNPQLLYAKMSEAIKRAKEFRKANG